MYSCILNVYPNSSCFERDQENFRKVVSEALNVQSWRVADVKYEQMKTDKDCMTYKFLLIGECLPSYWIGRVFYKRKATNSSEQRLLYFRRKWRKISCTLVTWLAQIFHVCSEVCFCFFFQMTPCPIYIEVSLIWLKIILKSWKSLFHLAVSDFG